MRGVISPSEHSIGKLESIAAEIALKADRAVAKGSRRNEGSPAQLVAASVYAIRKVARLERSELGSGAARLASNVSRRRRKQQQPPLAG